MSFAISLRNDVCHDVEMKPHFQPLQGETFALKSAANDDDARLDMKANGLRESKLKKKDFDVKNQFAVRKQHFFHSSSHALVELARQLQKH